MTVKQVSAAFTKHFSRPPALVARAPGRINLLGAHVDYHEGWVMPAAIDREVWLAAAPIAGATSRIVAADLDQTASLDHGALAPPVPARENRQAHWWDYPGGLLHTLHQLGHEPVAMDVLFTSTVPIGAGVSSSAAVEMAFLLAWEALSAFSLDNLTKAQVGQRTENLYLGVGSGLLDQLASLLGREGHLLFLDCRHFTWEPIPLPAGLSFLVADSGIRRRLTESGFNDRRGESFQALEILRRPLPGLRSLRDLSVDDLEQHVGLLPPRLARRARHVVLECRRVSSGAAALRAGDLSAFADIVQASHASSRDLYEVSLPELDLLADTAAQHPACHGARLMGGGFGGCVGALVQEQESDSVARAMVKAFRRVFNQDLATFSARAAAGAGLA